MDEFDARDFNKSRSLLVGWSVFVFCLWFFGADLKDFKLMGNEIKLTRNSEEVWLLMGLATSYLWFRCYQHLPQNALRFNADMNEVYDGLLRIWPRLRLWLRDLKDIREFRESLGASPVSKITGMRFKMIRFEHEEGRVSKPTWKQTNEERTKMKVDYYYLAGKPGVGTEEGWGFPRFIVVPLYISLALKVVAILIGVFTKSWFTDYVAPLVVGAAVALLSLHQWHVASPAVTSCS